MKRLLLIGILYLSCILTLQAQSKKELIAEIETLESELATTKEDLATSRKNEATTMARVLAIESQLAGLRETNASLLSNLNRITEESSKKTSSISESLINIQSTERQLRTIRDALTRMDSTTLSILTALKKTMGENARIGISNNVVIIAIDNKALFGENDLSYSLDTAASSSLAKIADILKKHPETRLQVHSHANALDFGKTAPADNLELSALRAVAVARKMSSEHGIREERIATGGKGIEGLSLETTTRFNITPDYTAFFKSIKDNIKN
jgi:chemotaxis protein MotB